MTAKEEYMHAVIHAFEFQYWGLQTTKATIFQNLQKVLDFQMKNSPVDPGGHDDLHDDFRVILNKGESLSSFYCVKSL